jgi:hypothetical protein
VQFHPEVRTGDLTSWARVPGYRRLLEAASVTPDHLAPELVRVAPDLDRLARQLSSAGSTLSPESPRMASGGCELLSERDARSRAKRAS